MSAPHNRALTLLTLCSLGNLLPTAYDATLPPLDESQGDGVGDKDDRYVAVGQATLVYDRQTGETLYDQGGASFAGDDDDIGDDEEYVDDDDDLGDDDLGDDDLGDDDLGDDEMAGKRAKARRAARRAKRGARRAERHAGPAARSGQAWQPWINQNEATSTAAGTFTVVMSIQSKLFEPQQISFDGSNASLKVKSVMAGDDPIWTTEGSGVAVSTFQATSQLGRDFFKAKKMRLRTGQNITVTFTATAVDQVGSVTLIGRRVPNC